VAETPTGQEHPETVVLWHGTSEGHLAALLRDGFNAPPRSAYDSVQSVAAAVMPPGEATPAVVDKLMKTGLRTKSRAQESNNGKNLFATARRDLAGTYAADNAAHGGEFAAEIFRGLKDMGFKDITPRFEGARPVILTLDVPLGAIADAEKMQVVAQADGTHTLDGYHEAFVNNGSAAAITGVTFAKPAGNGWSFEGQPRLDPQQALAQISAPFHNAASPATGADEPLKDKIVSAVYDSRTAPEAEIVHIDRKPVAKFTVTDAAGARHAVHIPDPRFSAKAQAFQDKGFTGVSGGYAMPFHLSGAEVDAYINLRDIEVRQGKITAEQAHADMRALLGAVENANPKLGGIGHDADNPAQVKAVLKGVVNQINPEDIRHFLSGKEEPGYAQQYRNASGMTGGIAWKPAPSTLNDISAQMERKLAAFNAPPTSKFIQSAQTGTPEKPPQQRPAALKM
jgi:hypothetical protein